MEYFESLSNFLTERQGYLFISLLLLLFRKSICGLLDRVVSLGIKSGGFDGTLVAAHPSPKEKGISNQETPREPVISEIKPSEQLEDDVKKKEILQPPSDSKTSTDEILNEIFKLIDDGKLSLAKEKFHAITRCTARRPWLRSPP